MINYVILACDQIEIETLLKHLKENNVNFDDIIVVSDSNRTSEEVNSIIESYGVKHYEHPLNNDFGTQRNFAHSKCWQPFIFHVDSDELPNPILLEVLEQLPIQNPSIDIFGIARMNYLDNDLNLDPIPEWISPPADDRGRIAWPDYQYRFMRNSPEIKWVNHVHEIPTGGRIGCLPAIEEITILHKKTVSGQMKRQQLYQQIQW